MKNFYRKSMIFVTATFVGLILALTAFKILGAFIMLTAFAVYGYDTHKESNKAWDELYRKGFH